MTIIKNRLMFSLVEMKIQSTHNTHHAFAR
jgi:hypothetical protein